MLSPIFIIDEGVGADEVKGRTRKEQSNHLETIMLAVTFTSLTLPKSYIHTIQERCTSKKEWPCWMDGRLKNTIPSVHNFDTKWGGTYCCHLLFKGQGTVGEWVSGWVVWVHLPHWPLRWAQRWAIVGTGKTCGECVRFARSRFPGTCNSSRHQTDAWFVNWTGR